MPAPAPTSIVINGTAIPYEERKSSRSKRISIRIGPERVRVTAPNRATKREIREFVKLNQDWIYNNWIKIQEKHQERLLKAPHRLYQDGETLPLLGQGVQLHILKVNQKTMTLRYLKEEKRINIQFPEFVAPEDEREATQGILQKWFKLKAREVFQSKLDQWSIRMGVNYKEFRLKEQKTRWGSCSSKGNINLNWRAVMAPESVVDYLVIHELAHLKHMDHSSAFWDFVSRYCPDYADCRHWLKVNGESLIL